jgi:hypothetical protein
MLSGGEITFTLFSGWLSPLVTIILPRDTTPNPVLGAVLASWRARDSSRATTFDASLMRVPLVPWNFMLRPILTCRSILLSVLPYSDGVRRW